MKKLFLLVALLIPSNALADRLGGLRSDADVLLTTQAVIASAISQLTPGSTQFIWNTSALQSGTTFFVSSGTVGGPLSVYGSLLIDRPDLTGIFDARASLSFNPNQSVPYITLRAYDASSSGMGYLFQNYAGEDMARLNVVPQSNVQYSIDLSSSSGMSPTNRHSILSTGKHLFLDHEQNVLVEFDPLSHSSSTIPTYAPSGEFTTSLVVAGQDVCLEDGTNCPASSGGGVATDLLPGDTDYIQVRSTLQSGATFYVSSGSISGKLSVYGGITSPTLTQNERFGNQALNSITTGDFNSAFGYRALSANTTGQSNSAFGVNALAENTTGQQNVSLGGNSLAVNKGGSFNAAFGFNALGSCVSCDANMGFGPYSLASLTGGLYNAGIGYQSLFNLAGAAIGNMGIGFQSGYGLTSGNYNLVMGYLAGQSNPTSGSNNILMGYNAETTAGNSDYAIAIGALSRAASHQMVVGSPSAYINSVYIGSGSTDTAPVPVTINGTGGSGVNIPGADVAIAGGRGTGTASGGTVRIQVSTAGFAGLTVNPLMTALSVGSTITSYVDLNVPTEVYDATGWNGDLSVPTKDAIRDKIETISAGGGGASTLAVTTGTSAGFSSVASSPTSVLNFRVGQFNVSLTGSATAYIELVASSVTFHPRSAKLPGTNPFAISNSTSDITASLLGDASANERVTWSTVLNVYNGRSLRATVNYTMASATSGDVVFVSSVACISPGDSQVLDSKTFGTGASITQTVPGTAGHLASGTITGINDSCAQGDTLILYIERSGASGSDTATGDVEIRSVVLSET